MRRFESRGFDDNSKDFLSEAERRMLPLLLLLLLPILTRPLQRTVNLTDLAGDQWLVIQLRCCTTAAGSASQLKIRSKAGRGNKHSFKQSVSIFSHIQPKARQPASHRHYKKGEKERKREREEREEKREREERGSARLPHLQNATDFPRFSSGIVLLGRGVFFFSRQQPGCAVAVHRRAVVVQEFFSPV